MVAHGDVWSGHNLETGSSILVELQSHSTKEYFGFGVQPVACLQKQLKLQQRRVTCCMSRVLETVPGLVIPWSTVSTLRITPTSVCPCMRLSMSFLDVFRIDNG